ncbi:restriction endonuclease subunit S, partial [bacterium]|nr:restriction endonuclease subunit S [bacterium]
MELKKYRLDNVATFEISNVDKKSKSGEQSVRLCNFTDVYYNWAVNESISKKFMVATASETQIKKLSLKKGQVAITKDSETRHDIGIPCYIAESFKDCVLGYHCALITPNPELLDGCYLNAYLNSKLAKEYFANNASGSGMRYSLPIDSIKNIILYLPDIETQRAVGKIFSNIDRKIALNREINRNLEAMARQLYDYWFVQFDFPDENGSPYKSSGGKMVW